MHQRRTAVPPLLELQRYFTRIKSHPAERGLDGDVFEKFLLKRRRSFASPGGRVFNTSVDIPNRGFCQDLSSHIRQGQRVLESCGQFSAQLGMFRGKKVRVDLDDRLRLLTRGGQ